MTIELETRIVERVADGLGRDWPFTYRIYSADHLRLYTRATSADVWGVIDSSLYTLALGTGDTLSGYAGGTVTYPISPIAVLASGVALRIERVVPYTQEGIDLNNVSGFNPEVLERELDYAVMRDQQNRDSLTDAGFVAGPSSAKVQAFTGDGTTTTFTLLVSPAGQNAVHAYLDGIRQHQAAFTLSGAQVIFTAPIPSGVAIEIVSLSTTSLGEADGTQVILDSGVSVETAIPLMPNAAQFTPVDAAPAATEGTMFYWSGTGSAPDGGANGEGLYIRKTSSWVFIA
jgi:hypothetical protein